MADDDDDDDDADDAAKGVESLTDAENGTVEVDR
jgi:hypothetical protein